MTNRYNDFEDITFLLKDNLLNSDNNTIKNKIITNFSNKTILNKELEDVYNIWKNKNISENDNLNKLYYFTKFDIPGINKITFDFTVLQKILDIQKLMIKFIEVSLIKT
jgi:hypothetical protein